MHNEGHRIDGLLWRSGNVYVANEYLANRKVIETIAVEVRRSFSLGAKNFCPTMRSRMAKSFRGDSIQISPARYSDNNADEGNCSFAGCIELNRVDALLTPEQSFNIISSHGRMAFEFNSVYGHLTLLNSKGP